MVVTDNDHKDHEGPMELTLPTSGTLVNFKRYGICHKVDARYGREHGPGYFRGALLGDQPVLVCPQCLQAAQPLSTAT